MSGLREFLHMGGYGFYVWTAYGLFAVVMAGNVLAPILHSRQVHRRLARELRYRRNSQ